MTTLSFGDWDLEVPDDDVKFTAESGGVRRAVVRGQGELDGNGTLTFRKGREVNVLWLVAGTCNDTETRNEVVEGKLVVRSPAGGRRRREEPRAPSAHLTPAGLVFGQSWQPVGAIDVARLKGGGERVVPHSVDRVLQTDRLPFRSLTVDWDEWRRWKPGEGERGSPVSGEVSVALSDGIALVVRPTAVFFEKERCLRLIEQKDGRGVGKVTLRPSNQPTVPNSWSVDPGSVALELAAFDRPTSGLWLRGAEDSWLHLRASEREPWALREPSVRSESRIAHLPSAPGTLLELLLDHSGSIRVDFEHDDAGGWKVTQVEVDEPALRLTHRDGVYLAEESSAPDRPPLERVGGAHPLTLLSPSLLWSRPGSSDGGGLRFALRAVGPKEAKLGMPGGISSSPSGHHVEAWRRPEKPIPSLDTPPSWAANDGSSMERPSRLRGLVPHRLAESAESAESISLRDGLALLSGAWQPLRFADESDRRSYALDEDLKLEYSAAGTVVHRCAVGSLDDLYRASTTLDTAGGLVSPDLTYVLGRSDPDASKLQETSWGRPVERTLAGGVRVVEECWEGSDGVRRWTFERNQTLAGLPLVAERWDGCTLIARPSEGSMVCGRLEICEERVRGRLRVKSEKSSQDLGKARWFDLKDVSLQNDQIVAQQSYVWHGALPDLVRSSLENPLWIEKHDDGFKLGGVPEGWVIEHDLGARVVVRETVWTLPEAKTTEPKGGGHGFAMKGVSPDDIRHLGSRLLIASATRHDLEQPEQLFKEGVFAKARTRVFLELERKDDGRLRVVGGMVGWEAGDLFGMKPESGDQSFPQLTLVWPINREGDRGPVLEINGTWRCAHQYDGNDKHVVSASFWDVVVRMREADDGALTLPESLRIPAIVGHQFPGPERQPAYAFQTAAVTDGKMDLSAVLFAESRAEGMTRASAMPRRGLAGFLVELTAPSRNGVNRSNGALIAMVRCGAAFSEKGTIHVDAGEDVTGAPLSWQRGVTGVAKPHERPELLRWSGTDAAIHLIGGDAETLRAAQQLSTLTVPGRRSAEDALPSGWLPCPVLSELKPEEQAVSARQARLWIVGPERLQVLHVFDQATIEEDVAGSVVALTGWHREAVLETWPTEGPQPIWKLVDSPLLNRSLPLRRFASGAASPVAHLADDGDYVLESAPPSEESEAAKLDPTLDVGSSDRKWKATLGASSHFVVHRAVPFERGVPQGLREGSRSRQPWRSATVPDGGAKPWTPSHLVWTPGVPRPGEQVAHAIETRGGSVVQMRFPRWDKATLEVGQVELRDRDLGHRLVEYTYRWCADRQGVLGRSQSRVLLHGPEAKAAHPEDPIRVWSFLEDNETLEVRIEGSNSCTAMIEVDGDSPQEVTAANDSRLVATLKGTCTAIIRATGECENLEVSVWQNAKELAKVMLRADAPRMLSSYGFVGLCDESGEHVLAFGPEPAAAWWPERSGEGVRWYRRVEHVEIVHKSTKPASSVFYIEPTGVRVTGENRDVS